ncbi:MAG: hypothetical protein AAF402_07010 [Pseudomonadota bacterium]
MLSKTLKTLTGFVGLFLLCGFIIGLSHSISTGFAGFWGGLPFVVIIACVLPMAAYDYWDECVRKKSDS